MGTKTVTLGEVADAIKKNGLPKYQGWEKRVDGELVGACAIRQGALNLGLDYSSLDIALRDDLDPKAARACAVLDPLKLKLVNFVEVFGSAAHQEACHAPVHPAHPDRGQREFMLTDEVWIEREDFMEEPSKGLCLH